LLGAVLVVTLAVFQVLPETARARLGNAISEISQHDPSHRDAHDQDSAKLSGLCHPGPDCIVAAVLTLQPVMKANNVETPAAFSSFNHARASWLLLFEPPPPRARF
jgi:hypothetical protein